MLLARARFSTLSKNSLMAGMTMLLVRARAGSDRLRITQTERMAAARPGHADVSPFAITRASPCAVSVPRTACSSHKLPLAFSHSIIAQEHLACREPDSAQHISQHRCKLRFCSVPCSKHTQVISNSKLYFGSRIYCVVSVLHSTLPSCKAFRPDAADPGWLTTLRP